MEGHRLYQRSRGETGWTVWTKVDTDKTLSGTIGGYYGGHYRLVYEYVDHAQGTLLEFKHITADSNNNRTVIKKRARVKRNGGLSFLN